MGLFDSIANFLHFTPPSNQLPPLTRIEAQGFRQLSQGKASYSIAPERRYLVDLRDGCPYITYDKRILGQLRRDLGTKFPRYAHVIQQDRTGYYLPKFDAGKRYSTLKGLLAAWYDAYR